MTQPVNNTASTGPGSGRKRRRRTGMRRGRPKRSASVCGSSRTRCAMPRSDEPRSTSRWKRSAPRPWARPIGGAIRPEAESEARVSSIKAPKCTPDGHAVSQPRHRTQRSMKFTKSSSTGNAPDSTARMALMRPRGDADSSSVARYVGQCGRQRPQDTQALSRSGSRPSGVTTAAPRDSAVRSDRMRLSSVG